MQHRSALASLLLLAAVFGCAGGAFAGVGRDEDEAGAAAPAPAGDGSGFQQRFRFPEDAGSASLFGIDVSHHQGEIDWSRISDQSVAFAYIKATQGSTHLDRQFTSHWQSLEQHNIFRGAYHFMSAVADPAEQAENFLKTLGETTPTDLPPCLDLEWDYKTQNGALVRSKGGFPIDRWARLSPAEVVDRALVWLRAVEARTGKRPIIYTSARWWKARIKDRKELSGYRLWIADYDDDSLRSAAPWVPDGFQWVFWQITDRGVMTTGGVRGTVDANYYHGTEADFLREFGLSRALVR